MAKLIVRYQWNGSPNWGLLKSDPPRQPNDRIEVQPLIETFASTADLLAHLERDSENQTEVEPQIIDANVILSPVTSDATIVCQGLNYADHAAEAGHHKRTRNLFFPKASSSLNGPYRKIIKPPNCTMLDYEIEVGLVLRNDITSSSIIEDGNIGKWIAGVTLCNDVSARDEMFGAPFIQWFRGKSFRTFCPSGPVLYWMAPEEVESCLADIQIRLSMNGEMRQDANTANWVFRPPESLRALAEFADMKRGDLVLTGTPGGVIAAANPNVLNTIRDKLYADEDRLAALAQDFSAARFLSEGDVLELEMLINGRPLGRQVTPVA